MTIQGVKNLKYDNIDLVTIRENTEGEYSGLEHEVVPGIVENLKIITKTACEDICRFAFEYAKNNDRKLVTCSHKAGVSAINMILRKKFGSHYMPVYLEDGAGGSIYNQATPTQIAQILYDMYHSKYKNNFLHALAVSGESGTLSFRMTSKDLRGYFFGKTGSMTGVSVI